LSDAELERLKRSARAAWADGDYAHSARRNVWAVGERIVRAVDVRAASRPATSHAARGTPLSELRRWALASSAST